MLMAARSEATNGQVYNLGSPEHINLKELADIMISLHGQGNYKILPFPRDRKVIDIGDYYGDFEKIRSALNWSPETTIEDGLAKTLRYYYRNIEHYL